MTTYKVRYTEDPLDSQWVLVESESREEALNIALDDLVKNWHAPVEDLTEDCEQGFFEVTEATEEDFEWNELDVLTKPEHEMFDFAHETTALVGT